MRRVSDEDGFNAGVRNWGRFWLSAIPLVLAGAALAWFAFYLDIHYFRRELSQEERAAIVTGAGVRPRSAIAIDRTTMQEGCAGITRADLGGRTLHLYATNDCHMDIDWMEWHYAQVSPNGTILHEDNISFRCAAPKRTGDSAECVFQDYDQLPSDDRVSVLRVWTIPHIK